MSVHVVELSPLKASGVRWMPQRGGPMVTVICKATFPLAPGRAELAAAQDDVNERDLHAENNPKKGLYSASDLAPFKRQPDVTLVGRCFAKPGELSRMLVARLCVADVDKSIQVHADRFFAPDGTLTADTFFTKMALGYERAAGGPRTDNPVGVNTQATARDDGTFPVPNLQQPDETLTRREQPLTPVGFGPIPASWRVRKRLVSAQGQAWLDADWAHTRVPADWDWRYFNVAPADQRPRELRDDQQLQLSHLHPEHPQLTMQLPGLRPCVYLDHGGQSRLMQLKADTLWIDTNRLVVTMCWRGQLEVADTRPVRALVATVQAGEQLSYAEVMDRARAIHRQRAAKKELAESDAKTQVRPARRSRPGAMGPRMTSPVPLVPTNDMAPAWLPPPSSSKPSPDGAAPSSDAPHSGHPSAQLLEIALSGAEVRQARQLASILGCSVEDALRHALQESYRSRFHRP